MVEKFVVRLIEGQTLFDDTDVEAYARSTFCLTPKASKRLVSNWDEFVRNSEDTELRGDFFQAASSPFDVLLGERSVARGVVASLEMLFGEPSAQTVIYGKMPLVHNERARFAIGKWIGDYKHMIEGTPANTFAPVLGTEITEHFRKLGKLSD